MRTYGRNVINPNGPSKWVEIDTDADGYNDAVWLTTLVQALKLNLGESPFYANYGIPAQQSVDQQLPPDYYVAQTQSQFAQYFASLIVNRGVTNDANGRSQPTYYISALTQQGAILIGSTIPS